MKVYRAQGHEIPGIPHTEDPSALVSGMRPVLATSKTPSSVLRYAGEKCCLFEIELGVGIRYIDVNSVAITDETLAVIREMSSAVGVWPPANLPRAVLRKIFEERTLGKITKAGKVTPPENEIMVDGTQGVFSPPAEFASMDGKTVYRVTYTLPAGRGRTFRRKPKRSNKNGRRFTRKSKHHVRRNRNA